MLGSNGVDRVELRDNNNAGEPHLKACCCLEGVIFARGGSHWLATREDVDGMVRFICTSRRANGWSA